MAFPVVDHLDADWTQTFGAISSVHSFRVVKSGKRLSDTLMSPILLVLEPPGFIPAPPDIPAVGVERCLAMMCCVAVRVGRAFSIS
jgi:hypothetical protein